MQIIWPYLLHKLAVESGIGIAVLVRSFTDKKQIESQIVERLGDGFSHAPFVTIVVCINFIHYSFSFFESSICGVALVNPDRCLFHELLIGQDGLQ